ncbi:MAG: DUF1489 family protein [Alphaproteobacteria bacterium]
MPLHLTKVAFGCSDVESLEARIRARQSLGELRVATRMCPRRADELVGGHLYWIIRHRIVGCNAILRFEDREDGRIDIVCSADFIAVAPRHCRAHQGWRYLTEGDAPKAGDDGSGLSDLPPRLYGRLSALALV